MKRRARPGLWALLLVIVAIAILVFVTTRVSGPDPAPEPLTGATRSLTVPTPAPPTTTAPVDAQGCSTDTYGGVPEHVANVGHYLAKRFKINSVEGIVGQGDGDGDRAAGLALDFYVDGKDAGDEFTRYLVTHRDVLDINYVIWWQRVNIGGEWVTMADRGAERNHYDSVHVSFKAEPEHTLTCE